MQLIGSNLLPVPVVHPPSSKQNASLIRFGLKYCPTMDLLAVFPQLVPSEKAIDAVNAKQDTLEDYYGEDEDELLIEVYRLNAQKVFTIGIESKNGAIGVVDLAWRSDGVILAIATSDNMIRLVNSFSGKIVHTLSSVSTTVQSPSKSAPTSPTSKRKSAAKSEAPRKRQCMPTSVTYSTHFADPSSSKEQLETAKEVSGTSLDDLLSLNADIETLLRLKPDLPRELASIDVEQYLPKLATLPANGLGEDDVFSTRTSIDTIFHPPRQHGGALCTDVISVAQSDANIHIRIFNSFEVGDVNINDCHNLTANVKLDRIHRIATHPFLDKLYILAEEASTASGTTTRQTRSQDVTEMPRPALHLLSLDLCFLQQSPSTLPIFATKATQLHNLIRYLRQIESQLAREIKTAFDLPARFLRALDQDLLEQDGDGSAFESSAYHAMLTGEVHGKFKEWLTDILGDRGVKRWEKAVHDCLELVRRLTNENWIPAVERAGIVISSLSGLAAADAAFGVHNNTLCGLRDTVDVMAILGEQLLKDTNVEMSGFGAFMKWLKREVEMAGLEDTSEKLDEMRENSDHSEIRKVFRYVQERLRDTSVKRYIKESQGSELAANEEMGFYQKFKQAQLTGEDGDMLSMKGLTDRLAEHCGNLFQQVADRLRANVLVEYICDLGTDIDADMMDARIVSQPEYASIYVVGRFDGSGNEVCFISIPPESLTASRKISTWRKSLDGIQKILDVRIADDREVIVLARSASQTQVVNLMLDHPSSQSVRHVFGKTQDGFTKTSIKPCRLEVNGRKNRRTMTVVDIEGRGYGVFDLDSTDDGGDKSMTG